MDKEQAEIDACKIEHLLSIETSILLATFMDFVHSGNPQAKSFLAALQKHNLRCTHEASTCSVCQDVCFVEIPTE